MKRIGPVMTVVLATLTFGCVEETRDSTERVGFEWLASLPTEDSARHLEAQVGPQAWPGDLPANWPEPDQVMVVADLERSAGERLLLADLPGRAARALDRYRASLERAGYRVEPAPTSKVPHALYAENDRQRAIVTFIDRDGKTRLEILFLATETG